MSLYPHYILDPDHTVRITYDVREWERWYVEFANRRVAADRVGDVGVSTVFLSTDHNFSGTGPPILFETMVFGGEHDQWCSRWYTWDQAETAHRAIVADIAAGREPRDPFDDAIEGEIVPERPALPAAEPRTQDGDR